MSTVDPTAKRLPLAGLRIIDLTRLLPGGYATQWLGDLGADVIKVEDPRGGDPGRWSEPIVDGSSLYFLALNRNKRSLALDLKAPEGRDALHRLIATADIVIESFRPGVMERLGLGPATLRTQFPRLIYCAITGYGQDGPAALRPGHDLNYLGYAGMLHLNRAADMAPALPATQIADLAGGALPALLGILTALVGRGVTGQGDIVDVSMLDSTLALQPLQVMLTLATGTAPNPGEPQLHGGEPVYGIYQAEDGAYLTLAALEPKFWERFCTLVEHLEWVPLHFTKNTVQREQLRRDLTTLFATRPRAAWLALLAEEDTCVGPVLTLAETLADPQVRARHMIRETNLGTEQVTQTLAPTPRLAQAAPPPRRPPPLLGEHSDAVLAEAGLSADEIATLHKKGIVPTTNRRK